MKQLTTVFRRHRWLLPALGYLLVLAFAVMYLRVTISVPPEGDDKLTLNRWLYDFERMPFWQYLLQDLQERLRYFTLDQVRFFPFHYPSAFSLLFFGTLTSYRLYIIGVTAAAAFLTGRVVARLARSEALALGAFTLTLALAPLFNEGMYSYYAVPQKTLFWAMAAWLCLLRLQDTGRRRWGVAAAVLAFLSCGTYEEGYMYAALAALVWVVLRRSLKRGLLGCAPVLGGSAVALAFHLASSRGSGAGNTFSLNIGEIARVTVQQMAASLPFLNPMLLGEDPGAITNGDKLWPLLLGVAAGLVLCFLLPRRRLPARVLGSMAGLGLLLWAGPALLLACSERYQQPEAITWKWGYIPAAASAVGFALLLAALIGLLAGALYRLPKVPGALLRLALAGVIAVGLCANGAYTRACLRSHHAQNLDNYYFFVQTIEAGLADEVTADDLLICNENVWDGNPDAESYFFSRFAGRELHAQVVGAGTVPEDLAGAVYGYQTYRNYGGYDLAWCGRAQDDSAELLDTLNVYVQGALVPDNAVIKYTVRLPDGTEEARAICLLDCDKTERNARGDYIATVEDSSILNAKVMIWDG